MSFDFIRFMDARGILYVTSGPNVSKGNVATHCPLCGNADPSQHMSVAIDGSGWRCWRKPAEHSGKAPHRLIMAMIGCSHEQAQEIAGSAGAVLPRGDFKDAIKGLLDGGFPALGNPPETLDVPPEFRHLNDGSWSSKPYVAYLARRGIVNVTALDRLGMYFAASGRMQGRVIFSVTDEADAIKAFVGRSISERATLRYLSDGDATPYLLWQFPLMLADGGEVLVVSEGPFDALKVSMLGRPVGINGTCFFTSQPSEEQVGTMIALASLHKRAVILLDQNNEVTAWKLADRLQFAGFEALTLPAGFKDPGELGSLADLLAILR